MRAFALILPILVSASTSAVAAPQSAEAFTRAIYAHYRGDADHTKGIDLVSRKSFRRYFAPDIAALMIADEEAAAKAGEVSSLDFDPFIAAQDWDIKNITVRVVSESSDAADVLVRFNNLGKDEAIKLSLVQTPAGWRISDILWPDNAGTLRAIYKKN